MPKGNESGSRRAFSNLALAGAFLAALWVWLVSPSATVPVAESARVSVPSFQDFPATQVVERVEEVQVRSGVLLDAPPVRPIDGREPRISIMAPAARNLHLIQRDAPIN